MKNLENNKVEILKTKEIMLINGGSKEARELGSYFGWKAGRIVGKYGPDAVIAIFVALL